MTMLRDLLFIARKDLHYLLVSRETLVWVFVMPIVFFYFIGTITAGFGGAGGTVKTKLSLEEGKKSGFLVDRLVRRLEEQDYEVLRPPTAEDLERYSRRLAVPDEFTDSVLVGAPTVVRYRHKGEGIGGSYENVRLGRALYMVLADVAAAAGTEEGATEATLARLDALPRTLALDVKWAVEERPAPSGFEQAIPGILVMFVLLVMTTSGAVLLVIERNRGLLRRLASTPIDRVSVVTGKWAGKLGLGLVQIAFAMLAGTVIFRMNWGADLPTVIAVLAVYAALMAALGLLLGSLARTEGQAVAIGVISSNALAALGGCWWPIEITPEWMQKLQLFLPTGWAMDAMHRLISFAAGPGSVLPHVLGMLVGTALLLAVATRVFRFE